MKLTIDFDDEQYHEVIDCEHSISITDKGVIVAGKFTIDVLIESISNAVASVYGSIKELDKNTPRDNKDLMKYLSGVMYNAYSIITHTVNIAHSLIEFEQDGETHALDLGALMTQMLENNLNKMFDEFDQEGEEEDEDE